MGFDDEEITKGPVTSPPKPLISAVLANFNHAKYIEDNFKGLLGQTYENWELIVVDDASTDHSRDVISRYASLDARIKPVYLDSNVGAAAAFNVGLREASGPYLFASAADDYVCNDRFFELVVQAIGAFPDIAGVFLQTEVIDGETEEPLFRMGGGVSKGYISPDQAITGFFEGRLFVAGSSAVWRMDMVNDVGYLIDLGPQGDYLVNHVLPCMRGAFFIEETAVKMRKASSTYSGSQSSDDYLTKMAKVERHILDHVGGHKISSDLRRKWRLHTINQRFRFYVQVQFVDMIRGFNPDPWECDGLPDRIVSARKWMREQADAVEREMQETYASADAVFNQIAGEL